MSAAPEITITQTEEPEAIAAPAPHLARVPRHPAWTAAHAWAGSRRSSRALKTWFTPYESTDESVVRDLPSLRSGAAELYRNAPLGRGALQTVVAHTIATGLRAEARIDRELLDLSAEEAAEWQEAAERIWRYHSAKLDISRRMGSVELDDLVLRAILLDGDVLMVRRMKPFPGDLLESRVQLIPAARVSTPDRTFLNSYTLPLVDQPIVAGVQADADGMPIRYFVSDRHPGDPLAFSRIQWTAVEAFATAAPVAGEPLSTLVFEATEGVDQTRGVPFLAPIIETLKQLTEYTEAELAAAVLASFFTVFTHTESGDGLANETASTEDQTTKDDEIALGRGAVVALGVDEKIETADPSRPNAQFDPYFASMAQILGVGLGLPKEVLTKSFIASYSASRAALQEAFRFVKRRRVFMATRVKDIQWRWVISEAIARGLLTAPGFFTNPMIRDAYLGVEWHGDPLGSIDPVKDAQAHEILARMGIGSKKQRTLATTGGDWRRDADQRLREQEYEDRLGLRPPVSAAVLNVGTTVPAGSEPGVEPEEGTGGDRENS